MPRLGLLLAALALAACGPSTPDLTADQAWDGYRAAVEAGDGDRAVKVLEAAAEAGDWGAMGQLAAIYERGYVRTPYEGQGTTQQNLPVSASRRKAEFARARFEAARDRAAAEGDPGALYQTADAIVQRDRPGGTEVGNTEPLRDPAAHDSAAAIYRQLVDSDLPRLSLAMLASALGDSAAYRRHIDEAVEAGEPRACSFKLWFSGRPKPDLSTLRGRADYYDHVLDCDSSDEARDHVAGDVRALHEQIALGNAASVVALDSLRRLGLFERHPWLEDPSRDA